MDKLSRDYELNQQVEKVGRLNHQIDFLTKENHGLENELSNLKTDMKRIQLIKEESRGFQDKVKVLTAMLEDAQQLLISHEAKVRQINLKVGGLAYLLLTVLTASILSQAPR